MGKIFLVAECTLVCEVTGLVLWAGKKEMQSEFLSGRLYGRL
jgi:hypothetical protein